MKKITSIDVCYHGLSVGKITSFQKRLTAFQYSPSWIREGFSISPLSLPLCDKVFISKYEPFDGLHGVFADSLPGWLGSIDNKQIS